MAKAKPKDEEKQTEVKKTEPNQTDVRLKAVETQLKAVEGKIDTVVKMLQRHMPIQLRPDSMKVEPAEAYDHLVEAGEVR